MPIETKNRVFGIALFPTKLESLNKFKAVHWGSKTTLQRWRRRRMWALLLRSSQGMGYVKHHGGHRRRVVIKRLLGKGERPYDDENIAGGDVKALCDALRDLEWIKDDTPDWRELVCMQVKPTDERVTADERARYERDGIRTIIQIEECEA